MSSLNADVEAVCAIVRARMVPQGRTIIAIAGPPASGKSTLAEAVVQELSSNVEQAEPIDVPLAVLLPMDGYHLDNRLLESKGRLDRKGAPNTFDAVGFCAGVRRLTEPSYEAFYPMFDRNLDMSIAQAISVHPDTPVVVVEGNYLLLNSEPWASLRDVFAATVFVSPPLAALRARLNQRWIDHGLDPEAATSRANRNDLPNAEYVLGNSTEADLILNQNN
jgi:pantothenate kinase